MEISWTDHVRNEVLKSVKEQRNILHTVKWRKVNWIGHILCGNCLLKQDIEGMIEVTGRRGRRSNQLDCSHLAWELPSKTGYWRNDKSDRKTRKEA